MYFNFLHLVADHQKQLCGFVHLSVVFHFTVIEVLELDVGSPMSQINSIINKVLNFKGNYTVQSNRSICFWSTLIKIRLVFFGGIPNEQVNKNDKNLGLLK